MYPYPEFHEYRVLVSQLSNQEDVILVSQLSNQEDVIWRDMNQVDVYWREMLPLLPITCRYHKFLCGAI
jgi:hypothetical protein